VRRLLTLLALAAASAAARPAAAQEGPIPPTPTNYVYARSMAMAAYRGLAGDNDAIFYNPAALAARKRFDLNLGGLLYRVGSDTDATMFGGSIVDSVSSPVTGGFSYNYVTTLGYKTDGLSGGMTNTSAAFAIGDALFLGVTGTYLNIVSPLVKVNAITVTAGVFMQLGKLFSAGFVGYNLINTYHPDLLPLAMGGGVAVGPGDLFHVTGDWYREYGANDLYTDKWSAGGEVFLFSVGALRGGWLYDAGANLQWWSLGAGFTISGFGADFGYRQSFGGTTFRTLSAMIKVSLPGM
jgi:hypothetical protein